MDQQTTVPRQRAALADMLPRESIELRTIAFHGA